MIALRPLTGADRALVGDVQARCADYIRLETGQVPGIAHIDEFLNDAPPGLTEDRVSRMAVMRGGAAVGLAAWSVGYPGSRDGYIGLLLLDPACRGKGIGTMVLARITEAVLARGCNRVLLCVLDKNTDAMRFWRARGFVPLRHVPATGASPQRHDRTELERPLP